MDPLLGSDPQAPSALATPQRNHYFYGKLLDVPHLELEQNYLNGKRWLLSRLLEGAGVISGLTVGPDAAGARLLIQPGVALDGWGREIVVPAVSLPFDPRTVTDDVGNPTGTVSGAGTVTIGICYRQCAVDPVPVLTASCNPDGECASGATKEGYVVITKPGEATPASLTCGFSDLFQPPPGSDRLPDVQPALAGRISRPYHDPTDTGCVPLAKINLPASGAITSAMVDNTVRPFVVSTPLLLEMILCLAQRVQQLASAPAPTPTPAASPTPKPSPPAKP